MVVDRPVLEADGRDDPIAETDDAALRDGWVAQDRSLDRVRVDGAVIGDDGVHCPVDVAQEAFVVEVSDIGRSEPASRKERCRRPFWHLPVSAVGHGAAHYDLAHLPAGYSIAPIVDDRDLEEGAGRPAYAPNTGGVFRDLFCQQTGRDCALLSGAKPVTPHWPQKPRRALEELGRREEDHDSTQAVGDSAAPFHLIKNGRQHRGGKKNSRRALVEDAIKDELRVERLIVEQHRPRAADQVGVEQLESRRPLQGVCVHHHVLRADSRRCRRRTCPDDAGSDR